MTAAIASHAVAATEPQDISKSEQKLAELVRKLTALRDNVVAGSHPRLKLPAHLRDKGRPLPAAVGGVSAMSLPGLSNGISIPSPAAGPALPQVPTTTTYSTSVNGPKPSPQQVSALPGSTSGIDPIFLQKSDTLVKAEAQAKRDRLEHNLEEQAQLKKFSLKHKTHDEFAMPEFSIDEVIRSAQSLVQPRSFRREGLANGRASSTDSFDENTFYSSQMNESTSTEGEVIEEPKRSVRPKLCRFFLNEKHCPYGDNCQFSHDPDLRAKVDGSGPGSHVRDVDGANRKEEANSRNKSPPRPVLKKGRDGRNDQFAGTETTSQQQRIAQLEAELEALKAKEVVQHPSHQRIVPPAGNSPKSRSIVVGPDEFGRDLSLRDRNAQQENNETQQQDAQTDREYGGQNHRNLSPPSTNDVRIIRNHITSPHAPQPSRVSPLAVNKISKLNQNQADSQRVSRIPYAEVISDDSPNISVQPLSSSRKRRRGRDAGEQSRNVVPRTGTSPQIRIKDEPLTPPPLHEAPLGRMAGQDMTRPVYIDVAPQLDDRSARHTGNPDKAGPFFESPPSGPHVRRIVSRNGQHYFASDEPDLRRVVSERQMRAPVSPNPRQFPPYTDPRIVRASSQAYVSPTGQRPQIEHRASVQPQNASYRRSQSPFMRRVSPVGPSSTTMAPPRRRVLMDQYGNEFLESDVRQVSVAPSSRTQRQNQYDEPGNREIQPRYTSVLPQAEPRYEQHRPRVEVVRNDFPNDERRVHLVERRSSPASPVFLDYSRPVQVIRRHDETVHEESYPRDYSDNRVIFQERHPEPIYEPSDGQRDGPYEVQNLRPIEDHYERISRVPSSQPRVVQINERQPMSPLVSRQGSVRPSENFTRSENFARADGFGEQYHYAPPTQHDGGYYREVEASATYEAPRRIIQRM